MTQRAASADASPLPGPAHDATTATAVDGRHWLLDLSDCRCEPSLLADRQRLENACLSACLGAGVTIIGSQFHQFTPAGVTGFVLLAESHLSVHTWPDERFAAVDVYVCNHREDNSGRGLLLARAMTGLFAAQGVSEREIRRGNAGSTSNCR